MFLQAPKSMKTVTIAAWYMSVAIGNLIVILVAQTKIFESRVIQRKIYIYCIVINDGHIGNFEILPRLIKATLHF